jgi:hypothetical protein
MFDNLSDKDLLALANLAKKAANKRKSRSKVEPGSYSGEVFGIKYSLTVGDDTTTQATDSLVMTRLALLLLERRKARLKKQDKALHVEELLERSLTIDCETHSINGELKKVRENYLQSLERKARKGAVKAAIV